MTTGEDGELIAAPCQCRERRIMDRRFKFAAIPDAFKGCFLQNFSLGVYLSTDGKNVASAACRSVKRYLAQVEQAHDAGLGLYLYSHAKGSGKTRMAASIANKLIERWPVKFATSTEILQEIRATYDRDSGQRESELIDALTKVDVLVIDDFGAENLTGWVNEKFYHIINERYIGKKMTFFTSNESVERLKFDDRIKSRVQEMTYQIPFPEESVRESMARERNRKIMEG